MNEWNEDDEDMRHKQTDTRKSRYYPKFPMDPGHAMSAQPILAVDVQRGVVLDRLADYLGIPKPTDREHGAAGDN